MSAVLLETHLLLIALVGVGGSILGLVRILDRARSNNRGSLVNALVGLVLLAAAGGSAAFGLPASTWAALAGLGTLALLFWAVNSPAVGSVVMVFWRLSRDRRLQGAFVLLCSPAIALWWVHRLEQQSTPESGDISQIPDSRTTPSFQEATEVKAYTDLGRPVPLFHATNPDPLRSEELLRENLTVRDLNWRLIRAAPPDTVSNCHGWLFAAGQFWLHGTEVDGILEDNGYRAVQVPHPGDLAVFRNNQGTPLHSALVRAAADDGLVLLEGKWGVSGRYIHAPADQIYSQQWTYYHSDRVGGHRLHGLGGETPPTATEATVATD